jgi:hypothetical protein
MTPAERLGAPDKNRARRRARFCVFNPAFCPLRLILPIAPSFSISVKPSRVSAFSNRANRP